MSQPDAGVTIVTKTASAVTYGGSSGAVAFGLTANEWSVVGVIGGLVIAFLGFAVNVYFKRQHLLIAQRKAEADSNE